MALGLGSVKKAMQLWEEHLKSAAQVFMCDSNMSDELLHSLLCKNLITKEEYYDIKSCGSHMINRGIKSFEMLIANPLRFCAHEVVTRLIQVCSDKHHPRPTLAIVFKDWLVVLQSGSAGVESVGKSLPDVVPNGGN